MVHSSRLQTSSSSLLKPLILSCACLGFIGCTEGVETGQISVPKRDGMSPAGGNNDAKAKTSGKQAPDNKVMMPGGKKM